MLHFVLVSSVLLNLLCVWILFWWVLSILFFITIMIPIIIWSVLVMPLCLTTGCHYYLIGFSSATLSYHWFSGWPSDNRGKAGHCLRRSVDKRSASADGGHLAAKGQQCRLLEKWFVGFLCGALGQIGELLEFAGEHLWKWTWKRIHRYGKLTLQNQLLVLFYMDKNSSTRKVL